MKKFNIKLDRPGISDEKILSTKTSFSKVLSTFKTIPKPFYKTGWFAGGATGTFIAGTILVSVYVFNGNNNNTSDKSNPNDTASHNTFVQPLKGQDMPYEDYLVSSNCSQKLTTKSGTCLHIPEDAFIDNNGNAVSYPIEVKYREMRNPIDFFRSGVPMTYDSAGTEYVFESAGMLELLAYKDDKPLKLANGKSITADMPSNNESSDFNIYYLDTAKHNWVYMGKDVIAEIKKENTSTDANDKTNNASQTASVSTVTPLKPVKAKNSINLFKMKVNTDDFPELNVYDNMLFQVSDKNLTLFNPIFFTVKWTSAKLSRTGVTGEYNLTLTKNDTSVTYNVIPVFDDKHYQDAIDKYDAVIKQQQEQKKKDDAYFNTNYSNSNINYLNTQQTDDITTTIFEKSNIVTRTFNVSSLGTWNCDRPRPPLNKNFAIFPQFVGPDNKPIKYQDLYIVDYNKNALFSYDQSKQILCNKKSKNLMWILTSDNQIGIVSPAVFAQGIKTGDYPKFTVNLLSSGDGVKELESMVTTNPSSSEVVVDANVPDNTAQNNTNPDDEVQKVNDVTVSCYPNPFPEKTTIQFSVPEDKSARVDIYDLSGKFIKNIYNGNALKGQTYSAEFDASSLPSGTYYYSLVSGSYKKTGAMVHTK